MSADSLHRARLTLEEMFRDILELPADQDVAQLSMLNEEKWDSLATVTLIAAIESGFGITLDSADYESMTSFAAVWMLVEEKLGG